MADNVVLNAMMGGQTISTEDIGGGLEMPRTKICVGIYGSDDGDVTNTTPFPCSIQNSPTVIIGSGTISLPSGAATDTNQTTGNSSLATIASLLAGTLTVSGAVTVSGSVTVSNFPASQTVTGSVSVSNFPASQTVTGSVSVGNFPSSQTVTGSVSVSNFPATQPVNGTVSAALIGTPTFSLASGSTISAALTGTPSVALVAGSTISAALTGTSSVALTNAIPTGSNTIGAVLVANLPTTQPVNGTVALTTGSSTIGNVGIIAGTANIGNVGLLSGATVALASQGTVTSTAPVQAVLMGVSDGTNLQGQRTPSKFGGTSFTVPTATQYIIWTPASGKKFRLMAYSIEATPNCTVSSAGVVEATLMDGGGTSMGLTHSIYMPTSTSVSNCISGYASGWVTLGSGYLSGAANNAFRVNVNTIIATGNLVVNFCGTEE